MSSSTPPRRWPVAAVAALVGLGLLSAPGPASAVVIQCPASADVFVWDGSAGDVAGQVGDGTSWADAYNWDQDCVPGLRVQTSGDGYDDRVTIPAGASVLLDDGESAHVAVLTNRATLTIEPGARLITSAASTSRTLVLRGMLAGTGRFTVTSRLTWVSTANGAATQTTRECASTCSTTLPASAVGTTVVAKGATVAISGRGVNLADQRVVENHGTVVLSNAGYVAADDGTWFRNVRSVAADPVPRFVIRNDGGYYQGFPSSTLGLSRFSNGGVLVKEAGTGLSVVDADYTSSDPASVQAGVVEVRSGRLSVEGDTGEVRTARVKQGQTFGNGGCGSGATPTTCAALRPTTDDPQQTTVELTQAGTSLATVTLTELAPPGGSVRGAPVEVHAVGAQSAPSTPMRFRMLLDASLVGPGETAAQVAQTAPVYRQATPSQPYVLLPSCDATGNPTAARPTCVSRARSVNETAALGSGDVVLVVSSLQTSRYRIGR